MTAAFKGGFQFKVGDAASPEVFALLEEVREVSGFGKTNPLLDATSFDSAAREYIAGLADGSEFTATCIRVHTASNKQDVVIAAVDAGSTINAQIAWTDGTTEKTYDFAVVALGYEYGPSYEDVSTVVFTLKITGDIAVS